jgi:hypothetical protein
MHNPFNFLGQDEEDQRSDRMKRRRVFSGSSTSSAGSSKSKTTSVHLLYREVCILCNKGINVGALDRYPGKLPVTKTHAYEIKEWYLIIYLSPRQSPEVVSCTWQSLHEPTEKELYGDSSEPRRCLGKWGRRSPVWDCRFGGRRGTVSSSVQDPVRAPSWKL